MSELKEDIASALRLATKAWKKQKLHEERVSRSSRSQLRHKPRQVSIVEAAFAVMEEAFFKASGSVGLAVARQIFYAARPYILKVTHRSKLKSQYFTQTLLKDYLDQRSPSWEDQVVWDARGHFAEPHTGRVLGVGGLEVRQYVQSWADGYIDQTPTIRPEALLPTSGPEYRFQAVLFIEKEGFNVILEAAGIGAKYDLAIMSSKGIPVGAACQLANHLHQKGVKVLVLRDFDKQGFTIVNTLRKGTRRMPGTPVVDLGLRLEDVKELGLEESKEPVSYRSSPARLLRKYGVTREELDFLAEDFGRGWGRIIGHRVELNAMTNDQLIEWLERKLEKAGVAKVIPDEDALAEAYQRAVFLQKCHEETKKVVEKIRAEGIEIPDGLTERVEMQLRERPKAAWDKIIWEIAKGGIARQMLDDEQNNEYPY